jgi:hypothetical protein
LLALVDMSARSVPVAAAGCVGVPTVLLEGGERRSLFGVSAVADNLRALTGEHDGRRGVFVATLRRTSGNSSVWLEVEGRVVGRLHPWAWQQIRTTVEGQWSAGAGVLVRVELDVSDVRPRAQALLPRVRGI